MYLSQLKQGGAIWRAGDVARAVGATSYEIGLTAAREGRGIADVIAAYGAGEVVDLPAMAASGALDVPVRHPDGAHMHLTGTGLTHTGSAAARDAMHAPAEGLSDSMKMFRMGIEGGKPAGGQAGGVAGVQPEWFYKGTGSQAVAPGDPLTSPAFALDGGEEPEVAGVYVIAPDGTPCRMGFCLANEFSDHVTERINYLFLAHSKLRPAAFGPELLVGPLPDDLRGSSRIRRGGQVIWERPFLSGEANMSHWIANLEHHHFKYDLFRAPGDLHLHMFGTATLSFADGIRTELGDVFEIEAPALGLPLKNPLAVAPPPRAAVRAL
jgi:hypothetical protein